FSQLNSSSGVMAGRSTFIPFLLKLKLLFIRLNTAMKLSGQNISPLMGSSSGCCTSIIRTPTDEIKTLTVDPPSVCFYCCLLINNLFNNVDGVILLQVARYSPDDPQDGIKGAGPFCYHEVDTGGE